MKQKQRYEKTPENIVMDKALIEYLNRLHLSGMPRARYTLKRRHLYLFSLYLEERTPLSINYTVASGFVPFLTENYPSYCSGYIMNIVKSVRGFYRDMVERKILLSNPFSYVSLPRVDRMLPRDIPSDLQIRKIIAVIPPAAQRDRAIIELLYGSGIRAGELLALHLDDLHLKEKFITVCDSKSKVERNVPINDLTVYALSGYLEGERKALLKSKPAQKKPKEVRKRDKELLFLKRGGFPLCTWRLSMIIEDYTREAEIPLRLTPHSFRHACATGMISSGCPLRYVQALLGHETISTTMIYTRLSTDTLKHALDKVHPHGSRS